MPHNAPSHRRFLDLIQFVVIASAFLQATAHAAPPKLNILFISSYSKDIPAQASFEEGLDRALGFSRGAHNLYFEFMDLPRLNEEHVQSALTGYLKEKYKGVEVHFLVGWDHQAIDFLIQNADLFPEARRIYAEVEDKQLDTKWELSGNELIMGVTSDFRASLKELLRLEHPRHILVIGTTEDTAARRRLLRFETLLDEMAPDIELEFLLDRSVDDIVSRLEQRSREDTIAFYLLMFSDGHGAHLSPYEVVARIARQSPVPTYTHWESLMGSGVVGGYVLSIEKTGFHLGTTILNIAEGKPTEPLPPMRHVYDWKALKRWGIDENLLPDNSIVLNRPQKLIANYKWHILAAGLAIILLSLLSLFLTQALKQRITSLRKLDVAHVSLAAKVRERTRELTETNRQLKHEIDVRRQSEAEKEQLVKELVQTLEELKTLKGILPFCSLCKKIRNDKGTWEQVDDYIKQHSDADISHSICPSCMKIHYPEEYDRGCADEKE